MTAYSRASAPSSLGRLVMEIQSVNRKMLDLTLQLPRDFLRFDIEMRKHLSTFLERGQVTLRLNIETAEGESGSVSNEVDALKGLKNRWEKICRELRYDSKVLDLPFLVSQMSSTSTIGPQQEDLLRETLKGLITQALQSLMQMKCTEGEALASDIKARLKTLEEKLLLIEKKKELPLLHYKKKLEERFKEIASLSQEVEERIARELVMLAEKMDVTEEIVRLRAHIQQFYHHLASKEKSIGRTLDFLAQEMHREINTLGAKSSDSEIASWMIGMKSELDKIREQVQNIE
jgi:uncharacterized protein (TIGR00255 family)